MYYKAKYLQAQRDWKKDPQKRKWRWKTKQETKRQTKKLPKLPKIYFVCDFPTI
jgi:hypothetical protein